MAQLAGVSRYFGLGLVTGSLMLSQVGSAPPPPLPEEEYWQSVQATKDLAVSLSGLPANEVHQRLATEADQWETVKEVELSDGTIITVNHDELLSSLRAEPPALENLEDKLSALLETHRVWGDPQWSSSEGELAIENLNEILSRPEFQWSGDDAGQTPLQDQLERLWQRIVSFLTGLLSTDQGAGTSFRRLALIGNILLVGFGFSALLLIGVYVTRGLRSGLVSHSRIDSSQGSAGDALTSITALERAHTLSSGEDYRNAVRYLYLSSLLWLQERGVLNYNPALTNREYLRSVSHQPRLATILGDIVETFDHVWYGYRRLGRSGYERFEEHVAELRQEK